MIKKPGRRNVRIWILWWFLVNMLFFTGFWSYLSNKYCCIRCPSLPGSFVSGSICLWRQIFLKVEKVNFTLQKQKSGVHRDCSSSTLEVWRSIGTAVETLYTSKLSVWRTPSGDRTLKLYTSKRHLEVIETAVEASLHVSLEVNRGCCGDSLKQEQVNEVNQQLL